MSQKKYTCRTVESFQIYSEKGFYDDKNCELLRLTSEDFDLIEDFVTNRYQDKKVKKTWMEVDFEFIRKGRAILEMGDAVYFYNDY